MKYLTLICLASGASAFPWMAEVPGIDLSIFERSGGYQRTQKRQDNACPFNADHPGAAPYDPAFPYTGARDGLPGTGVGGIQVPAEGDTAHQFTPPGSGDIRGPCPGMNTAANHNFLSHDGITNLAELLDAQQNLYNLDYDLALIIAVRAIALDGDYPTTRLSIGCDATERTSTTGSLLGREGGLNDHNKFEADTSLTRDDFFLANGDDYTFNGTKFAQMYATAKSTSGGLFDRTAIAQYRATRYDESQAQNPNFYFGPKALLLYGAASFVYEVFPVFGPEGQPDISTISTFFGAVDNGDGTYSHVPERIPEGWSNRRTPYTVAEIAQEIEYQYSYSPKLFGGNAGNGSFLALESFNAVQNGQLPNATTAGDIECLLYQALTENVPGQVANEPELPLQVLSWIASQINPAFANSGCALVIT